jgi:hypothetical protein
MEVKRERERESRIHNASAFASTKTKKISSKVEK